MNEEGEPWEFTPEQFRFVLWFYALDEYGKFLYRDITLQRCKGWGKDPVAVILAIVEMIGPSRFGGWMEDGQPVGVENPAAWVQIAAVSESQTKNAMLLVPQYLPKRTRLKYGMEVGKEKVTAFDGTRRLETITTSFRSQEGARPTLIIAEEPHHWVESIGGHDLYDVLERNLTKSKGGNARIFWITNAFLPGEDSMGERNRQAYDKLAAAGQLDGSGIFYDSLEAPPEAPLDADTARKVVAVIRGDSIWLDLDNVVKSIMDPRNPPYRSRRFWYNQITSAAETLIPTNVWGAARIEGAKLKPGDEIVLGFDGGRNEDATALIALRLSDRCLIPILIRERPKALARGWEVDRTEFDDAVDFAFAHYKVRAFFADVAGWESYVDKWSDSYRDELLIKATPGKSSVGFDMRGHQEEITHSNESLIGSIVDQTLHHNDDPTLREHVRNTRGRVNRWGLTFGKTKDGDDRALHNDAYAASLLAFMAMNKYLESGKRPKERSGQMWAF